MKKFTCLLAVSLFVVYFLAVPYSAFADVFMKQKQHTDAMEIMGQKQPAKDIITTIWMTSNKVRSDNEETSTILRLDKNVQYVLNHAKKTYMEIPILLGKDSETAAMSGQDKEGAEAMQNMMKSMMKMEINITESGEKKTIRGWKCKKYLQTVETFMGPMNSEVWATEDIKLDYDLYAKFTAAMFAIMPGMDDVIKKMFQEMKKIKGIPVLTTSSNTIMGQTVNSTMELLEFKEGKAPAGIFNLPPGYKKTDMPMGPM